MEVAEVEDIVEELVELVILVVLDKDEVGSEMEFSLNNDENDPTPEKIPESKSQGEVVYNEDRGHDGIFRWHLTGERNHNPCVYLIPDINMTVL